MVLCPSILSGAAVMNFIGGDHIFCGYPGPMYCNTVRMHDINALRMQCGSRSITFGRVTRTWRPTPYHTRSLIDRLSMFVDTEVQSVTTSYREMLKKFGVMIIE